MSIDLSMLLVIIPVSLDDSLGMRISIQINLTDDHIQPVFGFTQLFNGFDLPEYLLEYLLDLDQIAIFKFKISELV